MSTVLADRLKEFNEAIPKKEAEAQTAWTKFDKLRTELAESEVDVKDTESDAFKKADEAHKEYTTAAQEVQNLQKARESVWAMTGENDPEFGSKGLEDREKDRREQIKEIWHGEDMAAKAIASKAYKDLLESGALTDGSQLKFNVGLAKTERETFKQLLMAGPDASKTLITGLSDTSAGAHVVNDRQAGYYPLLLRPLFLTQLISVLNTDSDVVEFVRQTGFTNNAAETAEATSAADGLKPESAMAFEIVQQLVQNIAHWIPATRRALADAGQLAGLIDETLRAGVAQRLETQIISGAGTGVTLRGILATSGIATQAVGGDTKLDAIHKAITQIRLAFLEPTAVGLHPTDYQTLRLAKDLNGQYLMGSPFAPGADTLWGIPTTVGAQFPQGTGLVGKYDEAKLWIREGVEVLATDSHADFFVRNIAVLLAEMRVAFGVPRPAAFCQVTGL